MSCKDCENRHIGCHSECDEYKEFRKALDERNSNRRKAVENNINWREYQFDSMKKRLKGKAENHIFSPPKR